LVRALFGVSSVFVIDYFGVLVAHKMWLCAMEVEW